MVRYCPHSSCRPCHHSSCRPCHHQTVVKPQLPSNTLVVTYPNFTTSSSHDLHQFCFDFNLFFLQVLFNLIFFIHIIMKDHILTCCDDNLIYEQNCFIFKYVFDYIKFSKRFLIV